MSGVTEYDGFVAKLKRQCNAILTVQAWEYYLALKLEFGKQGTVVSAAIMAFHALPEARRRQYVRDVNAAYRTEKEARHSTNGHARKGQ